MDIRKVIKEEVKKVLINESYAAKVLPKTFDNLKWSLNLNQKYYLQDLCEVDPTSLRESDYKNASKFLEIPEKNVKSIINTYGSYNRMSETQGDSASARASRLTFGNKPASAVDIGITNNTDNLPIKNGVQMHTNDRGVTYNEFEHNINSNMKNRVMYKSGSGKEHPSKIRERFYENLNTSLMMYLYCESNPKDINLNGDRIQIDFEPVIEEGKLNQLGSLSYESEKYKFIKRLLEDFNDKFDCSYVIYEHVGLDDCQRIFIENNITKQIDMSTDSMAMMKKFLIPRVITGHKIEQHNAEIANLMGLDAGDTTWLYGPVGQAPQSGILTRNK